MIASAWQLPLAFTHHALIKAVLHIIRAEQQLQLRVVVRGREVDQLEIGI